MAFQLVNPEDGFTSAVIRDSKRFVGRQELIADALSALNSTQGMIAVYGKRGVGKSSLLRQIQSMAAGDHSLPTKAGLYGLIPKSPRTYYTVYYQCDAIISDAQELISRLCNDTHQEDGLLRLVPDKGKELIEFSRSNETDVGTDLKLIKWGQKGSDLSKYSFRVASDPIQSFRNFANSVVDHNNNFFRRRDSLLILLDEFDQIKDKSGLGSLIKSLTSPTVKFGICGIGSDINAMISDHGSVARLVQQGSLHVKTMEPTEVEQIFVLATQLFKGRVIFDPQVVSRVAGLCDGYPYFAQLIGQACVEEANAVGTNHIDMPILNAVVDKIRNAKAFPSLEREYSRAVGRSEDRAWLLALLAEQNENESIFDSSGSSVRLKEVRGIAKELDVDHLDQNLPRLIDPIYGPVLAKDPERTGVYEFVDPVFRAYVNLRRIGNE